MDEPDADGSTDAALITCVSPFTDREMQAKKNAQHSQQSTDEGEAGPSKETATTAEDSDSLFPRDVHERYLELSRRPRSTTCSCCGAQPTVGGKKLQVCSTCHRKAYCSAACQRQDWKEGGHKASCRPRKDFRKDDVVVAQGVTVHPCMHEALS